MNRIALALLATTAALTAASARAETRVSFGFNIGVPVYHPAPPAVIYAPAPHVVHAPPARGYWKDVTVKAWVPERITIRHNRWGRPERVCEPGYFTYTTDRVWVAVDEYRAPAHAPSYGHNHNHGRSYGYGHGSNRR